MRLRFFVPLLLAALPTGCAKPPHRYESADLAFDYPRNWRVEFDERQDAIHVVTLDADAELTASVSVFPAEAISLDDYVEAQQDTFREGVPEGGFRRISQDALTLSGRQVVDVRYAVGAKLQRSRFVGFENGEIVAFAFLNAPEPGFADAERGFQQLLDSLRIETGVQPGP